MNGVNAFLENKVMPVAGRIAGQRHLNALRDGIILTMPLIIIGSVFLILANLPIPGYADFMAGIFGDQWATKLSYPVGVTFDIMAMIATFGIAYRLAEKYDVDALSAGAIALAAFLLATPYQIAFTPEGATESILVGGGIPVALMGSKGLFVGMLIAMFSTEIYRLVIQRDIVIKMPDGVPPAVARSFTALIPGFIIITLIWLIRILIEMTSYESIHTLITNIIAAPLGALGGSLFGGLIAMTVVLLLWACGLHGTNIVLAGVMAPIYYAAMDENRLAYQAGEELPNIFTMQFFDIWLNMGGTGSTLALVVAMVLFAKSQQMKQLGKLAVGPALFNINEPIIFGVPIVLNPMLLIPFILTPLATLTLTYFAMSTGIVARPAGIAVPWTMPTLISGYLATGGKISGSVMQLVNFAVSLAIYYPFFKVWDRMKAKEEHSAANPTETEARVTAQ